MSILKQAQQTGWSREAITLRVKRFDLDPKTCIAKDFADLRPLDADQAKKRSLEAARTEKTEKEIILLEKQIETQDGEWARVDDVLEAQNALIEGFVAIARRSPMPEKDKEETLSLWQDFNQQWLKEQKEKRR